MIAVTDVIAVTGMATVPGMPCVSSVFGVLAVSGVACAAFGRVVPRLRASSLSRSDVRMRVVVHREIPLPATTSAVTR